MRELTPQEVAQAIVTAGWGNENAVYLTHPTPPNGERLPTTAGELVAAQIQRKFLEVNGLAAGVGAVVPAEELTGDLEFDAPAARAAAQECGAFRFVHMDSRDPSSYVRFTDGQLVAFVKRICSAGVGAVHAPTGWLIYTHERIDPFYWHGPTFDGDEWNNRPIKHKEPVFIAAGVLGTLAGQRQEGQGE